MTNSSPQPPENESKKQPILDPDEKIAIIVAFLAIGSIFLWSLGSDLRKGIFSISGFKSYWSGWTNSLLSSPRTTKQPDFKLNKTQVKASDNIVLNGKLSKPAKSEALAQTSKYLDRQPQIKDKDIDNLDKTATFTKPTRESLELTAPAATGIALGTRKMTKPDVTQPRTPKLPEKVTTPDNITPETPKEEKAVNSTTPNVAPENPQVAFTDIQADYWAYPFIAKLGEQKLISGFSGNDLFEPEKLITRASMATLISQAFDRTASQPARNFTDVSNQNALAADIQKAVETGFMKGYSEQEFRPLENIPRYQVLVALVSGLDLKPSLDASNTLSKFDDTENIPNWAREQVAAAIEAGLAVNRPEFSINSLQPNEPATRAEVAAMIHQALVQSDKLEPIDSQYIVRP